MNFIKYEQKLKKANENFFKETYGEVDEAKILINKRLERLRSQAEKLKKMKSNMLPLNKDVGMLYNMKNLADHRNIPNNQNLLSYQQIDPIYYPLEMPVAGEPVQLPRIELGQNMRLRKKGNKKISVKEILPFINSISN